MEEAIKKLSQWYQDEQEILDDLAHDVALADSVDDMMRAKSSYEVQSTKVDTILGALNLIENTK